MTCRVRGLNYVRFWPSAFAKVAGTSLRVDVFGSVNRCTLILPLCIVPRRVFLGSHFPWRRVIFLGNKALSLLEVLHLKSGKSGLYFDWKIVFFVNRGLFKAALFTSDIEDTFHPFLPFTSPWPCQPSLQPKQPYSLHGQTIMSVPSLSFISEAEF